MEYLGCNENGQNFKGLVGDKGVGTFGGSEDHTAIMSCSSGNLNMYSYCPTINEGACLDVWRGHVAQVAWRVV